MYGEVGSPGTTSKLTGSGISGPHAQRVAADDGIAGCRELEPHPVTRTDAGRVNVVVDEDGQWGGSRCIRGRHALLLMSLVPAPGGSRPVPLRDGTRRDRVAGTSTCEVRS